MDLGLPSGTLWLDRPLGATDVGAPGFMYQWGALVGYMSTEQFSYTRANYEEQELDLITTDLTPEHDAAAKYYGETARIPFVYELQELIDNTSISIVENVLQLRSNINGNVISIHATGIFNDTTVENPNEVYIWSRHYRSNNYATGLHINSEQNASLANEFRYKGLLILPVHS